LLKLGGDQRPLHFGPAHVVWEDENFNSAEWCLEHFDEYKGNYPDEDLAVVKLSLEDLAKVPLVIRCLDKEYNDACNEDHDANPDNYPPPDGVIMVKRRQNARERV
jgi:hypothetical protein